MIGVLKRMIERYSRDEMSNIWTDQNRYEAGEIRCGRGVNGLELTAGSV